MALAPAVALLLGLVLLGACTGAQPREPGDVRPGSAVPVPDGLAERCPPRGVELRFPEDGVLADGAVAVRLCNGPAHRSATGERFDLAFDPPDDLLTTDIDALVGVVNDLEPLPEDRLCHADLGPTSIYWFLYPDGDARAVRHDGGGCEETLVGRDGPVTAGVLPETFRRLLLAQREHTTPPGTDRTAGCNPVDAPIAPLPLLRTTRFATAAFCAMPDGIRWREATLTPRQVERLTADLADSEGRTAPRCPDEVGTFSKIVGHTVWGDRFQVSGRCFTYEPFRDGEWVLAPATMRMLRSLELGPFQRQCARSDRKPCPAP